MNQKKKSIYQEEDPGLSTSILDLSSTTTNCSGQRIFHHLKYFLKTKDHMYKSTRKYANKNGKIKPKTIEINLQEFDPDPKSWTLDRPDDTRTPILDLSSTITDCSVKMSMTNRFPSKIFPVRQKLKPD